MPYVHIEADEVLGDISDKDLLREARERGLIPAEATDRTRYVCMTADDVMQAANDLRETFYRRDASRFEALVAALEMRTPKPAARLRGAVAEERVS